MTNEAFQPMKASVDADNIETTLYPYSKGGYAVCVRDLDNEDRGAWISLVVYPTLGRALTAFEDLVTKGAR